MRNLALFFSRGVSLQLWVDKGLFEREKLLYEVYLEQNFFHKIYWLTYGSKDGILAKELKRSGQLHKSIEVISMPKIFNIPKFGSYLYSFFLPLVTKKYLKKSMVYKTNQTDGSWSAVLAKKLYKKKLLYRTGYTMSQLENSLKRFSYLSRKFIEIFEAFSYRNADFSLVASRHNLEYVQDKYSLDMNKISINYNFIDHQQFYDTDVEREEKVVFVGRLSDEKNIFNLIKALEGLELPLEIYGSGPLEDELTRLVNQQDLSVKFMGNIANNQLPEVLNKAKYFALVSSHEGMPKALIEGMACGCVCIGTNVTGINEVILHNNGLLAKGISSKSIQEVFLKAKKLNNSEVTMLKRFAKEHIEKNFTLQNVFKKEKRVLEDLLEE